MLHLDINTDYSFTRGIGHVDQVLDRVEELGAKTFGIADYLGTWGHIPFMKEAAKRGLGMVYGVKIPLVHTLDKRVDHSIVGLFAQDPLGLKQLYHLVSISTHNSYYRPRLTWDQIREATNVTPVLYFVHDDTIMWGAPSHTMMAIWPSPGLELSTHPMHQWIDAGRMTIAMASPSLPSEDHRRAYDVMQMVAPPRYGDAMERLTQAGTAMLTLKQYRARMQSMGIDPRTLDEALARSEAWAGEFAMDADQFAKGALPEPPEGWDLYEACIKGAYNRGLPCLEMLRDCEHYSVDEIVKAKLELMAGPYRDRLDHEINIIQDKGFAPYFFFVSDVVAWARAYMLVGPGRGSAGGSLVAFLLGITDVDPIVHGTLFERFIDPTRNDFPDIDVDFEDAHRDLVFKRLAEIYGEENVARIGTVTKLGAKGSIRDVARAERSVPWADRDALLVQADGIDVSLKVLFGVDDKSQQIIERSPQLAAAADIEGHARHTGIHAAGVIVSALPIEHFAPVSKAGVAQLTLDDAETVGLLKFDALGLTTLSTLREACSIAGISTDELQAVVLGPMDDDRCFEVIRKDDLTGVFQLTGHTVRGLTKAVHVDRFSDICALTSLARPGPLQGGAASAWVHRRGGSGEWEHPHPAIYEHTRETFGLIVYQEQMMKIMRDVGGFDVAQVNQARKATGKKIPELLASLRDEFVQNSSKILGDEKSLELWHEMEEFGGYAFNLSHAVAYSMITYMCCWMRAYHKDAFNLALLRSAQNDPELVAGVLKPLMMDGYKFIPWHPVHSETSWTIVGDTVYGGFTQLKGVGDKKAARFLEIREGYWVNGQFQEPERWVDHPAITDAQRLLLSKTNTPWASFNEVGKLFGPIFASADMALEMGLRHPLYRVDEVPEEKGSYTVIAKLKSVTTKDSNEPARVEKRGGQIHKGCTKFYNLKFIDDGVEIGATINRFKMDKPIVGRTDTLASMVEAEGAVGSYFAVRGDILGGGGPKWLMIDRMKPLGIQSVEPIPK